MASFGPTGELVFNRTYSRPKQDGTKETWAETVRRVVDGNLALVDARHIEDGEREELIGMMEEFKILPAGRHLWASGTARSYLFNCHVAGWGDSITDHFEFAFLRLMEGGGVGSNYTSSRLAHFPGVVSRHRVHIVCDPEHADYEKMREAGVLSSEYDADWPGAFAVEDSREGWASALTELLSTYYRYANNFNRVFDVSRVRPEGARLKTFGGHASGPEPLARMLHEVSEVMNRHDGYCLTGMGAMEIDHAIAQCVVSGGNRRSARMAIMHWNDPKILDFLRCKESTGKHWTTNISVEVDEEFWKLHAEGNMWVVSLLDEIARGMLHNGEPGIWDSSYSNHGEPGGVVATNPCGEIPLESWENCNLGHVNVASFAGSDEDIYLHEFLKAHRLMTRFLMRATYGSVNDEKQADALARNRRIGVGHFGFASAIAKLGIRYADVADDSDIARLLTLAADEVNRESVRYAHQMRIPIPVKRRTVAPTGTIAKMPGVSEGIHPIFAKHFIRRVRFSSIDPGQFQQAMEYAARDYKVEPCRYAPNTYVVEIPTKDTLLAEVTAIHGQDEAERIVQSADEVTLDEMLSVQAMYQKHWADNAVSYTANINPEDYTVTDIAETLASYGGRIKGATVFPETSLPQAPYERISREQYEQYEYGHVADGIDENCASGACPVR